METHIFAIKNFQKAQNFQERLILSLQSASYWEKINEPFNSKIAPNLTKARFDNVSNKFLLIFLLKFIKTDISKLAFYMLRKKLLWHINKSENCKKGLFDHFNAKWIDKGDFFISEFFKKYASFDY